MVIKNLRWYIVGLLFIATTINYLDRQTLSVAAPILREQFGMSNTDYARIVQAFLISYCIMQSLAGRIIDWLGTKRGFAMAVVWWAIASILHVFARGVNSFAFCRFLLGMGEAGNFPAAIKTVSESILFGTGIALRQFAQYSCDHMRCARFSNGRMVISAQHKPRPFSA